MWSADLEMAMRTLTTLGAGAALLLAACGGGNDVGESAAATSAPATTIEIVAEPEGGETSPSLPSAESGKGPQPSTTLKSTAPVSSSTTMLAPALGGGQAEASLVLAAADAVMGEAFEGNLYMEIAVSDGFDAMTLGGMDRPFAEMAVDAGGRTFMSMDLSALSDEFSGLGLEPSMEFLIDGLDMYLRGEIFALISQLDQRLGSFASLDTSWGRLDLTVLAAQNDDLSVDDITGALGGGSVGFEGYIEALRSLSDVSAGEPSAVNGVPTTYYVVQTTFGDLLESNGGLDTDQLGQLFSALGYPDSELQAALWAMEELPVLLGVDVDAEGRLRRFHYELDMGSMLASMGLDEEIGAAGITMTVVTRMDVLAYGGDISVEVPTGKVADITEAFSYLLSLG